MWSRAFSLLELLVVLLIVGILSTVAIPAYDRYVVKAQVIGLISIANAYKVKLVEDVLLAASAKDNVYNIDSETVDNITVFSTDTDPVKFVVQLTAKMKIPGRSGIGLKQAKNSSQPLILQLQGVHKGEIIDWSCHVAPEYNEYMPTNCRNNEIAVK